MRKLLATGAFAAASIGFAMNPAGAATQQGLVNVNLEDVTVQVPVAVAANVCDTEVNVLARSFQFGKTTCTATAESVTVSAPKQNGKSTKQEGLVNVNIDDVVVQVPISVAANICDTTVNALAMAIDVGPTTCDATAGSTATS
jgi:hypothetical protein